MVKKQIRASTRVIFTPLSFSPHTLSVILHHLYVYPVNIPWQDQKKKCAKLQFPMQSTSHLLAASHIWPRGYGLLSSSRRIPVCRDYNSFSGRLTSLFNPLGKSLRFSTTYSILWTATASLHPDKVGATSSLSCCKVPWENEAAVPLCSEASGILWCTQLLRSASTKTKQVGCMQNEQMATAAWELTARFSWGWKDIDTC